MIKIRQKYGLILLGITVTLLLSCCSNDNKAAEELIEYHNDAWLEYLAIKDEKLSFLKSDVVSLASKGNNSEIERLLNEEILPSMEELIDYLQTIELENKNIQQLNQSLLENEQYLYQKFEDLTEVLNIGEKEKIEEKYEEFRKYNEEYIKKAEVFFEEREKLMDKYNVEFIEDEDGQTIMAKK